MNKVAYLRDQLQAAQISARNAQEWELQCGSNLTHWDPVWYDDARTSAQAAAERVAELEKQLAAAIEAEALGGE